MKKKSLEPHILPGDDLFGYGGKADGKPETACHPVNLNKGYQFLKSTLAQSKGKRIDKDIQALFALCHIFGWGVEANSVDSVEGLLNITRLFADRGHALSCFFMGCYKLQKSTNGEQSIKKNPELKQAHQYFNKAIDLFKKTLDNPTSALFLAICYEQGYGITIFNTQKKPNLKFACALYEYSAQCHNAFAKYRLGILLQKLDRHDEAYQWLASASRQNWLAANTPLSKYEEQRSNVQQAKVLREQAIAKNDSQAILEKSLQKMSILSSDELIREEKLFQEIGLLAKQETDPLASFHYGCMLQDRNQDKEAVFHYRNAAKHGLMDAEYNLALCFHKGIGTDKDPDEAYKYFKRAAEQQHPYSLYALGWYDECKGYKLEVKNPIRIIHFESAIDRYKKSAKHHDTNLQNYANFAIARIYSQVYKNTDKAIHYFRKAAINRDRDAMRELAHCLMHDTDKIEGRYFEEAAQWLKKATELGDRASYDMFCHDCWPMLPKLIGQFEESILYVSLFAWQNNIKKHIERTEKFSHVSDIIDIKAKPIVDKTLKLGSSMPLPRLTKDSVLKEIFSIDRLKLNPDYDHPLGSGGFGVVYPGEYENMPIAIKALNVEKIQSSIRQMYFTEEDRTRELRSMINDFGREVNRMLYLNHRNIIRTYGFVDDLTSVLIVMAKMEGGSLQKHIDRGMHRSPLENLRIALEISAGLNYLHNQGILHNDMKADNVLFSADNTPVICDFGLSSDIRERVSGGGTLNWNGPECFEGAQKQPRSIQSDIWSLALVIWSLYANETPFEQERMDDMPRLIVEERIQPSIPLSVPEKLKNILLQCWSYNPIDRPASVAIILATLKGLKQTDSTDSFDRSSYGTNATNTSVSQVAARTSSPLYHNPFDNMNEEDLAYHEHNSDRADRSSYHSSSSVSQVAARTSSPLYFNPLDHLIEEELPYQPNNNN